MTELPEIVWDPIKRRYAAYLFVRGNNKFLGYYQTAEDAAKGRASSALCYAQDFVTLLEEAGYYTKCG